MNEIILVTGGAGFVGSHLIKKLSAEKPQSKIISLDNYFTGKESNHLKSPNITYLRGDTRDIFKIWKKEKLPNPAFVYHLGEYARITQSFEDFDTIWEFNINGTKETIKFASEKGAKFIYAGSSSKFGNKGADENLSPYAWIKAKNVEIIQNYSNWFGLNYVITYFYNVYGPGHIKEGKYATVIGIFERLYEEGKPLTVVSPGTQTRDFTHINDIVDGLVLCAENGQGDGYQLGKGQEKKLLDVAKMFKTKVELIPARKGERIHGRATSDKALKLGWKPQVNLEDYIANFIRENPQPR